MNYFPTINIDECTELMLAMLFRQYDGFVEVRMVPGKAGIAFVEFGDAIQATAAKNGLQGFKITTEKPMRVTFAKA
jgi:U2 small nuclear ribonucleoprotein B''